MKVNKLSPEYTKRVLGYYLEPNAKDNRLIKESLRPFKLDDSEDSNSVVELPLPNDCHYFKDEVDKALEEHKGTLLVLREVLTWQKLELPSSIPGKPGWHCYHEGKWLSFDRPINNKTFVLDLETVEVSPGQWYPTCAIGLSNKGWIYWQTDFNDMAKVIPLGNNNTIIGYNISYDRSYIEQEYYLEETGNRFFDLMSAWVVCRGMSNQQLKAFNDKELALDWVDYTSSNGLDKVYEFYFGEILDKGVREEIVGKGLAWVQENMREVALYCFKDVQATLRLYRRLYPEYLTHRPSDVAQVGHLLLGSVWLPLDAKRFPDFYNNAEFMFQQNNKETGAYLMGLADLFYQQYCDNQLPHHADLDWTPALSGKNKGLPLWYRDILSLHKRGKLTLATRESAYILGLKYNGEYLRYADGWYTGNFNYLNHPDHPGDRLKNLFIKNTVQYYEEGLITADSPEVNKALAKKIAGINWLSVRKRVQGIYTYNPKGYPVVLPRLAPNGATSGRATDSVWQVASNPKKSRIGTELKSMVSPPDGYVIVGADVASQEAWLAGCFGDSLMGFCGSTPLGYITIAGNKGKTLEDSTDIHSIMARETGMTRDNTKTRVYGALYGQGIKGDTELLIKSIPGMSLEDAEANSRLFTIKFKGQKARGKYYGGLASEAFNEMEARAMSICPRTQLLGNAMSKALTRTKDFKPSKVNWQVQSSGVDFRDLLVILQRYYYKKLGVRGRLLITIHDEIRTLVKKEDAPKAAYALQLAHLYTRCAFINAFGLDCIPAGVAWFPEVDVDEYCLRKDPFDPQVTPSQPVGLPLGKVLTPVDLCAILKEDKERGIICY